MSGDKNWYNHLDLESIKKVEDEIDTDNFVKTQHKRKRFDDGTSPKEAKKKRAKKRKDKLTME
jgi:hypothetical protein